MTESSDAADFNITTTAYQCDLENKLQKVTKGNATTTMKYYANGLRAKKEAPNDSTYYVYNTVGKLVAESSNTSAVATNYVWGPDRVLVKKVVGGGDYYYLYNGHGDVVQMVDRNGNVVNNYNYDEWGNITTSNETINNPFKYAGEVYDQETGLYYLRARYYDPKMGRFINEDSNEGQVNNPLSLNVYSYCYNSPLNYIDSTGNSPSPLGVALGVIGGIAGWQFGDYVAKELGCKGWKYWTVRAAVTIGGVAIGFFAGELVAGIVTDYLEANPAIAAKLPGWVKSIISSGAAGGSTKIVSSKYIVDSQKLFNSTVGHIFSKDHIDTGIMKIGKTQVDIFNKLINTINNYNIVSGSNEIRTVINGVKTTIRFFVKDGKIININAFAGYSERVVGTLLKK